VDTLEGKGDVMRREEVEDLGTENSRNTVLLQVHIGRKAPKH